MVDVLEHQSQKWINKLLDLHRHDDKSCQRYRTNLPKSQTLKQIVSKQERERERERLLGKRGHLIQGPLATLMKILLGK